MKKKLYDFSKATAIMVLLAYLFMIIFSLYSSFDNERVNWLWLIASILLLFSLVFVIWYFVILAVTITDKGVTHGRKFIHRKDVKWKIEYNRRFRYEEIVFYDKYIDYDKLDRKQTRKKAITVQYFPKYESFLREHLPLKKKGIKDEEK
jgi:hypothetical protein